MRDERRAVDLGFHGQMSIFASQLIWFLDLPNVLFVWLGYSRAPNVEQIALPLSRRSDGSLAQQPVLTQGHQKEGVTKTTTGPDHEPATTHSIAFSKTISTAATVTSGITYLILALAVLL